MINNPKLKVATLSFYLACTTKLIKKDTKGFVGWDDSKLEDSFKRQIKYRSQQELTQKNLVNIANYCNFLWNLIEDKKEVNDK